MAVVEPAEVLEVEAEPPVEEELEAAVPVDEAPPVEVTAPVEEVPEEDVPMLTFEFEHAQRAKPVPQRRVLGPISSRSPQRRGKRRASPYARSSCSHPRILASGAPKRAIEE